MLVHGWVAEIVDIETVFLYDELGEQIFMKIPDGYEIVVTDDKVDSDEDCFVIVKIIHGLTQVARQF